jgi:acyl-CoA thioester hydrolase
VKDEVHVDSWVDRLGTSSMAIAHTIFANGEPAAEVKSVVVYFDYASSKSMPLTEEMRAGLQQYVKS